MIPLGSFLALALVGCIAVTQAQAPGPRNQNLGCIIQGYFTFDGTYYYSPADTDDFGIYAQSTGTCDPGSFAQVELVNYNFDFIQCGYLPLDGSLQLISCPNYPRGPSLVGRYRFNFYALPAQYEAVPFTIVHSQVTETAPAPTQTVTITPNEYIYITQVTVTSPSSSKTNTIVVTPSSTITTTTTITRTISLTIPTFSLVQKTTTSTAPCTNNVKPMATGNGSPGKPLHRLRARSFPLLRRDIPNQGEGIDGDGPLTMTITPDPTLTTATAAHATTTVTITSAASIAASTTVPNPTPTSTIYRGSAVYSTTTTLAPKTTTTTRYALTTTRITSTKIITFTNTVKTTPACRPTK